MLDTPRITAAFELAARVHARQRRTGTKIPYIAHPMAVASQVLVWGGSEDQFIAALLHDVLEDGGAQYVPVIAEKFGSNVLRMVEGLSDAVPQPGEKKAPWLERKTRYLAHLAEAGDDTLLVSIADKWHNLSSILADVRAMGDDLYLRFVKEAANRAEKKRLTLWYYSELVGIYERRGVPGAAALRALLEEVRRA